MEDKRTALAVFICIMLVMFYSEYVLAPYQQEARRYAAEQQRAAQPTTGTAQTGTIAQPLTSTVPAGIAPLGAPPAKLVPPSSEELAGAGSITISSPLMRTSISLLGGRLEHYTLERYRADMKSDARYDVVWTGPGMPLPLGVYTATENDAHTAYAIEATTSGPPPADRSYVLTPGTKDFSISLRGTLPSGVGIRKTYRFSADDYLFTLEVALDQPSAGGAPIWVEWTHVIGSAEAHARTEAPSFSTLSASNSVQHILDADIAPALTDLGPSRWVAYADRYFIAALIPSGVAGSAMIGKDPATHTYVARAAATPTGATMQVYVGPKDDRILSRYDSQLDRAIDLGTFAFLAHPLLSLLRLFNDILGNYGLAIILLTLVIKLLFLPLTKASFESMQKMQQIQPEMKALRERITDPNQLNRELMDLYKRRGVNPMGGCLPILIQIPVFLGLYNALLNSIELRHAPFALWINDLSAPEHFDLFGIGIPVMVLLMGVSMFYQQMTTPSTLDKAQQRIMLMLPVVFTISFIIFPFPAGLVLYWLVNNLISITQQVYLRSEVKASPVTATVVASLAIFCFGFVLTLF